MTLKVDQTGFGQPWMAARVRTEGNLNIDLVGGLKAPQRPKFTGIIGRLEEDRVFTSRGLLVPTSFVPDMLLPVSKSDVVLYIHVPLGNSSEIARQNAEAVSASLDPSVSSFSVKAYYTSASPRQIAAMERAFSPSDLPTCTFRDASKDFNYATGTILENFTPEKANVDWKYSLQPKQF